MQTLHLPGFPPGSEPSPFRFPDKPASPSDLIYTPADYPEPLTPSSTQEPTYLIRVLTTALTRGELTWQEVLEPSRFKPHGGAIPGHDVVGVVEKVLPPSSVSTETCPKFSTGDRVWALLDFDRDGAASTFTLSLESELSLAPCRPSTSTISQEQWDEQLATLPLSCLTAYQALFIHGGLPLSPTVSTTTTTSPPPKRVLVLGAAGSVGLPALQLAKVQCFTVIALCSTASEPLITSLLDRSADSIISYASSSPSPSPISIPSAFQSQNIPPVDLVLDCIGGSILESILLSPFTVLNPSGRIITIVAPIPAAFPSLSAQILEICQTAQVSVDFFVVKPSGSHLDLLGPMVSEGRVKGHVDTVFELKDGKQAMARVESRGRKAGGKVVLRVAEK